MRFQFRTHTGPTIVREVVKRLQNAGIDAHDGTEHVYGTVEATDQYEAAEMLNKAAGFKLAKPHDVRKANCTVPNPGPLPPGLGDPTPCPPETRETIVSGPGELQTTCERVAGRVLALCKAASLTSQDKEILEPPLDLTPKGAQAWVSSIRIQLLTKSPGSRERAEFAEEANRKFSYVAFLFKGRKGLNAFLKSEGAKLSEMIDTVAD